jgi:hypothetical protein
MCTTDVESHPDTDIKCKYKSRSQVNINKISHQERAEILLKYNVSGNTVTFYLLSVGKLVLNAVLFLLTENTKRGNHGISV